MNEAKAVGYEDDRHGTSTTRKKDKIQTPCMLWFTRRP